MGDRGNIIIGTPDKPEIYLYTHWSGTELPLILQRALAKRWRWDDDAYLTRIIFCEMVGDDVGTEAGYGISTRMCDNEHPLLFVDVDAKRVHVGSGGTAYTMIDRRSWTFEEYIALPMDEKRPWRALGKGGEEE